MPMELEASIPPTAIRLQQTCQKYALRTMRLPENHPIRQRTSTTFPREFTSGIEVDIQQQDWDTINSKHSQLWKIHNTIANLTPSTTYLEGYCHQTLLNRQPPSQNPVSEISQQPHHQLTPNFRSLILVLPPTPIKFSDPALFFCISYCKSCGYCGSPLPLSYPCQG